MYIANNPVEVLFFKERCDYLNFIHLHLVLVSFFQLIKEIWILKKPNDQLFLIMFWKKNCPENAKY